MQLYRTNVSLLLKLSFWSARCVKNNRIHARFQSSILYAFLDVQFADTSSIIQQSIKSIFKQKQIKSKLCNHSRKVPWFACRTNPLSLPPCVVMRACCLLARRMRACLLSCCILRTFLLPIFVPIIVTVRSPVIWFGNILMFRFRISFVFIHAPEHHLLELFLCPWLIILHRNGESTLIIFDQSAKN